MKRSVLKIISLIMVFTFVVGAFFVYTLHNNEISISQTSEAIEYYINGENDFLRFGVEGKSNLFEPNETINVVIECRNASSNGSKG